MRKANDVIAAVLVMAVVAAQGAGAQTSPDIWRSVAAQVDLGSEIALGLQDGRRFRASLVGVTNDALLVQPKTRVPVPIQAVPYEEIVRMERTRPGIGAGKAVAIGVVTGVGAFFGIMALMFAAIGD
jgi:hypothetical protein